MSLDADVIVVGAGLAGLVAAAELADAGRRVIVLDQEPEASLGGQAFWSFGGLFFVNSPEQRRVGVRDSFELARQDWLGSAGFDRPEDAWPRRWAEGYVEFRGNATLKFRHRVDRLVMNGGTLAGVAGTVLEPSSVARGQASSRGAAGEFSLEAPGRDRDLGRDRRQPRAGARELAIDAGYARAPDEDRARLQLVRPDLEDHREGVRSVGLGAEPGSDRARRAPGAGEPLGQGRAAAGRGVQAPRPRLRGRARLGHAGPPHERPHRRGFVDARELEREIKARDRELANPYSKDLQITAIRGARRYIPDRLSRVAAPHRLLDPGAGPLIAVRLWILTRKTLGGLETDLSARVLRADGAPVPGLYAAGEVAGFGGGGVHGYRSLEGTFLGGCLFSGRAPSFPTLAGRA